MGRATPTLLAVVAIASWTLPSSAVEGQGAGRPAKAQARPPQKARPGSSRPPLAKPSTPTAKTSPAPALLESETGPSESDTAKLARVRARRQAVEGEIRKLQRQAESTLRDLDAIDLDLRLAAHKLDEAGFEFRETIRRRDATVRDMQVTKLKIEATRPRVLKSLVALSKLGELSYARLLLSLDDPSDILRGYRYVARIASADGDQINAFRASLIQLSGLEQQLKKRTAQNLETRRRLNAARGVLRVRKANKEMRLEVLGRERKLQEQLAAEYQMREGELRRLLGESQETRPGDAALRSRKGELSWPASGTLVRKFGMERDATFGTRTIQQGIEIDAFPEIEVHAVHAGRVVFADQFVGYGMLVIIDHGHREHTLYGRLGELSVGPGDDVLKGSLLGLLPNTRVTGSGLHFEVRVQGKPEDPLEWLKKP